MSRDGTVKRLESEQADLHQSFFVLLQPIFSLYICYKYVSETPFNAISLSNDRHKQVVL
jgi:hypothetical protein